MKKFIIYNQARKEAVIFQEANENLAFQNKWRFRGSDWTCAHYCPVRKYTGKIRKGYALLATT